MRLIIVGSSSAGNCYILENEKEALLIECGVRWQQIRMALGFDLSKVVGCLVTHEHKDHCKAVGDVLAAGIEVYATSGTHNAMGVADHRRARMIREHDEFRVGSFRVRPFNVKHDAAQPVGFLINHDETGTVLFLTDTYYVEYTFHGLHNIIVEANFCQQIVDQKVRDGVSPKFLRDRVLKSHLSLQNCKDLLAANELIRVNNIVLIHLSDSNSDADRFQREISQQTGKTVHIADAGMVIENFNKSPF